MSPKVPPKVSQNEPESAPKRDFMFLKNILIFNKLTRKIHQESGEIPNSKLKNVSEARHTSSKIIELSNIEKSF